MKYRVLFESGRYALILRGESMSEYAVIAGLDKAKGEWDYTIYYCWFGKYGYPQEKALSECLEVFRYKTELGYISRNRLIELCTRFKDNLIAADPEAAVECFDEDCDLPEEEKDFFEIDYDDILNGSDDISLDDLEDMED